MKKVFVCLLIIISILVIGQNYSMAKKSSKTSKSSSYSQVGTIPTIQSDIEVDSNMYGTIQEIYNVVAYICYAAAFIVIIVQGVKFMIAAPEAQAEIKKQSIAIVTGTVIVFGIIAIVQIIMNITNALF